MTNLIKIMMIFMIVLNSSAAHTSTLDEEVQYLLNFIASSGCMFIRNDTEYSAKKARSHIQRKYNNIKNKITTTEQVIKYSATKSSLSGNIYYIKCPDIAKVPSADWLTKELMRYRKN